MCHMNKYYNTQEEIASKIKSKILEIIPNIRKSQLKIIPFILIGMLNSESIVASDISNYLKDDFSLVQHGSVVKRIRRFFKNKLFNPYLFYDQIIRYVISNYKKKHSDNRVHIVFDHMFSKSNYTVFMITMRIGKTGIPLWFRCFKEHNELAFKESLLKEGISYVSSLFDKSFDLIFLADRWFNSVSLLKHIDTLGHTFCVRLKRNINIFIYSNKEKHYIKYSLENVSSYQFKSKFIYNIHLTDKSRYKVNLVISKRQDVSEPWIIVTNASPKRAIKDYGYRFGAIETVFKNQKSNGFYLEKTVNASLKYFESEYTFACLGILFMTMLGIEYSKNTKCYKDIKIETQKLNKNKSRVRVLSLFHTGLILFHRAFNSSRYIRLPIRFILYDM